jgi:luciferase family oxidoreductase group 1
MTDTTSPTIPDSPPGPGGLHLEGTTRPVRLSVLDTVPISERTTPHDSLWASSRLAQRTEELGFHRYWVTEHHSMPAIASSSPAVLLAHLGAVTDRIRLGSGGVMLPNHAPLVVAEQFGMLESFHPGRIDLGLGRAPGTDQVTAMALRRAGDVSDGQDFPQQLAEVVAFLSGSFPEGHPYRHVRAVPQPPTTPEIWLLGSSGFSAQLAGMLGLPFCFAHHFNAAGTDAGLELYRRHFRPSDVLDEPYSMVAVVAVCAETDAEATYLAGPMRLSLIRMAAGLPTLLPTPEEAAAYQYTAADMQLIERMAGSAITGSAETVRAELLALAERTQVDELMVGANLGDVDIRLRCYELLAERVAPAP